MNTLSCGTWQAGSSLFLGYPADSSGTMVEAVLVDGLHSRLLQNFLYLKKEIVSLKSKNLIGLALSCYIILYVINCNSIFCIRKLGCSCIIISRLLVHSLYQKENARIFMHNNKIEISNQPAKLIGSKNIALVFYTSHRRMISKRKKNIINKFYF